MLIRTPREVGLLIKDRRRDIGLTQAELAERVGASREWVRQLESGKPRLELGLTLRALTALGIALDAEFGGAETEGVSAPELRRRSRSRG